jgi:hypothetical protein
MADGTQPHMSLVGYKTFERREWSREAFLIVLSSA